EVLKAGKRAVLGRWTIPFRLGDGAGEPGRLEGRFEYNPPRGTYTAVQKSSPTPAAGLKLQVVPGTVPAVFIENLTAEPVVILGRDGEPFARVGPKEGVTEVNAKSPTWAEVRPGRAAPAARAAREAGMRGSGSTPRWPWRRPSWGSVGGW